MKKTTSDDIETIIFDCGRVLTMDQDKIAAQAMADLFKTNLDDFLPIYVEERPDYDRGIISANVYWARIASRFGIPFSDDLSRRAVAFDMDSWFTINPEMVALAQGLKNAGFKLLILSNMNAEGKERMFGSARFCGNVDWLSLFDEVLLSCDLRMLKPNRDIYEKCLDSAASPAERCLFIDDIPANVSAARELGINAEVFVDPAGLRSALEMDYSISVK